MWVRGQLRRGLDVALLVEKSYLKDVFDEIEVFVQAVNAAMILFCVLGNNKVGDAYVVDAIFQAFVLILNEEIPVNDNLQVAYFVQKGNEFFFDFSFSRRE